MLSLIIALPDHAAGTGEWRFALSPDAAPAVQGHDGTDAAEPVLADHGSAALALLPRGDEVVAVVPARRLSWHRVTVPRIQAARLRSALEGLLEERLLDEPASLHFALAPGAAAGQTAWVAACDKAWLQDALHALEAAGRPATRIVPECTPLPEGSAARTLVTGSPESAWLLRRGDDGVQVLPLQPAVRTALGLDAATEVQAEPSVAALAEQLLGGRVRVRHSAQGLVSAARSPWDLAQGDLASTGRIRLVRRAAQAWAQWSASAAWRPARWGLAAALLVNLVGLNAWAWKERAALDAKRAEVRSLLTRSFPRIPVVVDAPVQMEREVAALRQSTGAVSPRDLEPMLTSIAAAAQTSRAPAAIDFVAGELVLKDFAPPPADAAAIARSLAAAGYSQRAEGNTWTLRHDGKPGARP